MHEQLHIFGVDSKKIFRICEISWDLGPGRAYNGNEMLTGHNHN